MVSVPVHPSIQGNLRSDWTPLVQAVGIIKQDVGVAGATADLQRAFPFLEGDCSDAPKATSQLASGDS